MKSRIAGMPEGVVPSRAYLGNTPRLNPCSLALVQARVIVPVAGANSEIWRQTAGAVANSRPPFPAPGTRRQEAETFTSGKLTRALRASTSGWGGYSDMASGRSGASARILARLPWVARLPFGGRTITRTAASARRARSRRRRSAAGRQRCPNRG